MNKFNLKEFIWSIFLLIIGLVLIFLSYPEIALLVIIIGLFGISWKIHTLKKGIKPNSKKWGNIFFIYLLIFLVIYLLLKNILFNVNISFGYVVGSLVGLVLIYFYLRFLVPKLKGNGQKRKFTFSELILYIILIIIIIISILILLTFV